MNSNCCDNRFSKWRTPLMVAVIFVGVAMLTLILVISREQWLASNEQALSDQRIIMVPPELVDMQVREDSILGSSALLDSASATYRIPITQAMELISAEAGK